jgi:hypothetical protein
MTNSFRIYNQPNTGKNYSIYDVWMHEQNHRDQQDVFRSGTQNKNSTANEPVFAALRRAPARINANFTEIMPTCGGLNKDEDKNSNLFGIKMILTTIHSRLFVSIRGLMFHVKHPYAIVSRETNLSHPI